MGSGKGTRINLLKGLGLAAAAVAGLIGIIYVLAVVRASTADAASWIILALSAVEAVLAIAYAIALLKGRPKLSSLAAFVGAGLSIILPSSVIGVPAFLIAGVLALVVVKLEGVAAPSS